MFHIANDLTGWIEKAIQSAQADGSLPELALPSVKVTRPTRPRVGDYDCPVEPQVGHLLGISPQQVADAIIAHFPLPEYVSSVEQYHGYLNFRLAESWLQRQVDAILQQDATIGQDGQHIPKRIQIECISANPTRPLTVGRIRGGIIGDKLARLLRAQDQQVELEYCYNNAGR